MVFEIASSISPASAQAMNVITAVAEGDVEQQRGEAIGERLRPAAGLLRLVHKALDTGEGGVGTDGIDHARVPTSRSDTVPATTRSPTAVATGFDSPVIIDSSSSARAVDDRAVRRHAAARPDEHQIADPQVAERHDVNAVAVDDLRFVREQLGERGEHGRRAWPIAFISCQWPSSMTVDERRQLPPELELEQVEAASPATTRRRQ